MVLLIVLAIILLYLWRKAFKDLIQEGSKTVGVWYDKALLGQETIEADLTIKGKFGTSDFETRQHILKKVDRPSSNFFSALTNKLVGQPQPKKKKTSGRKKKP